MSVRRIALAAAVLLSQPALAATVTIDARALTTTSFDVVRETGSLSTAAAQAVELPAGPHDFRDQRGNSFAFSTDGAGLVSYDAALGFLTGAGTSQLVVVGYPLQIDAHALTSPDFDVPNITSQKYPSTSLLALVGIPGSSYAFRDGRGNNFSFAIAADGTLAYGSEVASFASGAGSSSLVVQGFRFSFDARALTAPSFDLPNITGSLDSKLVQAVVGIPGPAYGFRDSRGNNFSFTLDGAGKFAPDPALAQFTSGTGTSQLTVLGFHFAIDARALTAPSFDLPNITGALDSTQVQAAVGIPGAAYGFRDVRGNAFGFTIDGAGKFAPDAATAQFTSGAGTSQLTVLGYPLGVDARGLGAPSFAIVQITGLVPSASVLALRVIPGAAYGLSVPSLGGFGFTVDAAGLLQGLPASLLGAPVTGAGTNTLRIGANSPPTANAGGNLTFLSRDQASVTLHGLASDAEGDPLTYRWLQTVNGSEVQVKAATAVGAGGAAPLALATLPALGSGAHTFRLEVSDPTGSSSDSVVLTADNSPPSVSVSGGGTWQIADTIRFGGSLSDFDGDAVSWRWLVDGAPVAAGTLTPPAGGTPVPVPGLSLVAAALGLGSHSITLTASDGFTPVVTAGAALLVVDRTAPSLAPVAAPSILWPPNGSLVPVRVLAHAADDSGHVTLSATVTSSEPVKGDAGEADAVVVGIDQATGVISLELRAARAGRGPGRTYSIAVVATDGAGNASRAVVTVVVPHDRGH